MAPKFPVTKLPDPNLISGGLSSPMKWRLVSRIFISIIGSISVIVMIILTVIAGIILLDKERAQHTSDHLTNGFVTMAKNLIGEISTSTDSIFHAGKENIGCYLTGPNQNSGVVKLIHDKLTFWMGKLGCFRTNHKC